MKITSNTKITASIYPFQLEKEYQDQIIKLMKYYGLANFQIDDAMNDSLKNLLGNPECPINAYVAHIGMESDSIDSGMRVNDFAELIFAPNKFEAKKQIEKEYERYDNFIGVRIDDAKESDILELGTIV